MEEFLELAYQRKHDAIEEVKADCKAKKATKDLERKRIGDVQKLMDNKRKEGMVDIKKKINEIIMNDSMSLIVKLGRLYDDEIKAYMNQCLQTIPL